MDTGKDFITLQRPLILEKGRDAAGYCVFTLIIEEEDSENEDEEKISDKDVESESDESDDDKVFDLKSEYKKLYLSWLEQGEENMKLAEEKVRLQEVVTRVQDKLNVKEEENMLLEHELRETKKQIKMMNSGTKDLDTILSYGRVGKSNHGIGYQGMTTTEKTTWVAGTASNDVSMKDKVKRSCFGCGRTGHIKRFCYKFGDRVKKMMNLGKYFPNRKRTWQVWMSKADLYPNSNLQCNMAFISCVSSNDKPWYFDSGASRHMTGVKEVLNEFESVKETKVTFGGGDQGRIKGKGKLIGPTAPELVNVYYVQDLKANLISVSQLCDEGLTVAFNKVKCWAVNEDNEVVLSGIRTGNSCYMWDKPNKCFNAEKKDHTPWDGKLGRMNVRSMTQSVNQEHATGVPELEKVEKTVCKVCNQGMQIKVEHKKVQDDGSLVKDSISSIVSLLEQVLDVPAK